MARYEADKEAFSKRLKSAFDDMGWPVRGRAKRIQDAMRDSVSLIAVRKWLMGDSLPEVKRIGELSILTGKTVQWLLTGVDSEPSVEAQSSPVYVVPLISWVSAGMLCCAGDVLPPGAAEKHVGSHVKVSSRAFALRVCGDSMTSPNGAARSYPSGSIIIVDPDVEAKPGCRVVARVGNEMTFKTLVEDAGKWYLKPLNPQYPMIDVTENVYICGVVRCTVYEE